MDYFYSVFSSSFLLLHTRAHPKCIWGAWCAIPLLWHSPRHWSASLLSLFTYCQLLNEQKSCRKTASTSMGTANGPHLYSLALFYFSISLTSMDQAKQHLCHLRSHHPTSITLMQAKWGHSWDVPIVASACTACANIQYLVLGSASTPGCECCVLEQGF